MKLINLKNKPSRDILIIILFIASLAASIAFATMIAAELINRSQGRDFFSTMYLTYVQDPVQELGPVNPAPVSTQGTHRDDVPYTKAPASAPALTLDFSGIINDFPDVVAWIVLDNTVINYPVVQGDDNVFYLTHLPNGEKHTMGSIFMDYRNAPDFSDKNTIIYGHNMASGDMFAALNHYRSQEFYEAHPVMKIKTPHHHYILTLFAAYIIDSAMETVPINFDDHQAFKNYVTQAVQRSDFTADVDINYGDRLVTLVTCTNIGPLSYRYIVVGRLD